MVASLDSSSQFPPALVDDLTATVSEADAITPKHSHPVRNGAVRRMTAMGEA